MSNLSFLAGVTGGLFYHSAAFRHRRRLWRPFVHQVENWLEEVWDPDAREIILFGPSAGWTISKPFLSRFKTVYCVEPDATARFLFRRRFAGDVRFVPRSDLLPWFSASPTTFSEFLGRHPQAAVLFTNLLGQIPLLLPSDYPPGKNIEAREVFYKALSGREWASYHDLFSAPHKTLESFPARLDRLPASEEEAGALFFPAGAEALDHDTLWLSRDHETWLAPWQIRPSMWHVIGFVRS